MKRCKRCGIVYLGHFCHGCGGTNMKKNSMMNSPMGTLVDVAIGGAAMNMVSNSSMPQGIKDVTNLGIGVGIMGRAMGRMNYGRSKKKGDFF